MIFSFTIKSNPGSSCVLFRMTRNVMSVKEEFCTNGWADLHKKSVQAGNDQEKAQSERNSHSNFRYLYLEKNKS